MVEITAFTIFTFLIYLLFLSTIIISWSKIFITSSFLRKRFIQGFYLKVLSGLSFIIVYAVFYGGWGDSHRYFLASERLVNIFLESPSDYFSILFSSLDNLPLNLLNIIEGVDLLGTQEEFIFSKIVSVFSILGLNNYLVITLFFSTFAFITSWGCYRAMSKLFLTVEKQLFFGFFLIPSLFFWGGALLKDGFIVSLLYLLIYILFKAFFHKKYYLLFIAPIVLYFMINIKAYVIISFIPALLIGASSFMSYKITNVFLRYFLSTLFLITMISSSIYLSLNLGEQSQKYNVEDLEDRIKGFHSWHSSLGGSAYDLGEIEFTPIGVISKIPDALNVTFFRPYFWEVHNIVMLTSAMESFFFLFLLVKYVFIREKVLNWIGKVRKNPFFIIMLVFSLIFGFSVGFTSYNFGALVRYKIPCLTFFYFLLVLPSKSKLSYSLPRISK